MQSTLQRLFLGGLLALLASCHAETTTGGLHFVTRAEDGSWVDLEIDRPGFVDFGKVPTGTVVTHTFNLQNRDRGPVTLERLDASCGCTVPSVQYETETGETVYGEGKGRAGQSVLTLPAGAVAEVTLRINTHNIRSKNVPKYNFVRVLHSSEVDPYLQLEAHIIAEQPFHATPLHLDFGKIARSGGGVSSVDIARGVESDVRIVGLEEVPEEVVATLEQEWVNNVSLWRLRAEIVTSLEVGAYRGDIAIALETVAGEPYPSFRIPLRASVLPDVEVRPARLHLGVLDPLEGGDGSIQILSHLPDHRFKILEVELDGDASDSLEVDWSPLSTDADGRSEGWEVRLSAAAGVALDVFSGTVRVHLDDAEFSPVVFEYAGMSPADS